MKRSLFSAVGSKKAGSLLAFVEVFLLRQGMWLALAKLILRVLFWKAHTALIVTLHLGFVSESVERDLKGTLPHVIFGTCISCY